MRLNNPPADRQPHAHAVLLGGENGSNNRGRLAGSMPGPESATDISTCPSPVRPVRKVIWRLSG